MKRISSFFVASTEKKEQPVKPAPTRIGNTGNKKLGDVLETHPIHVTVLNGYERFSYLLAGANGAQDLFGDVDGQTPIGGNAYDDEDYDVQRAGDGEFSVPVNSKSGRGTLKAFSKSTERGGRGGLRTIVHELGGKANAVVIKRPDDKSGNGYYYGSLDSTLRMDAAVPVLVIAAMTEGEVRALLAQDNPAPAQFKYLYGDELKKLSGDKKAKYEKESLEYQEKNTAYWKLKSQQDYWRPLIAKIDAWKKAGETLQVVFVSEANLQQGKDFLQRSLAAASEAGANAAQKPKTIHQTITDLLLPA